MEQKMEEDVGQVYTIDVFITNKKTDEVRDVHHINFCIRPNLQVLGVQSDEDGDITDELNTETLEEYIEEWIFRKRKRPVIAGERKNYEERKNYDDEEEAMLQLGGWRKRPEWKEEDRKMIKRRYLLEDL